MYLSISGPEPVRVELRDHDDCTYFHVAVPSDMVDETLSTVFAERGLGDIDGAEATVSVPLVRDMAQTLGVGPDWSDRFSRMIEYAKTKGWVAEDELSLVAHIERTRTTLGESDPYAS